jgi:hypothetical protein
VAKVDEQAGSEKAAFELIMAAALGAGLHRFWRGLGVLEAVQETAGRVGGGSGDGVNSRHGEGIAQRDDTQQTMRCQWHSPSICALSHGLGNP